MARTVSLAAMQAIMANETEKVFLVLLDIEHEDLVGPIRLVDNTVDIVSETNTYTAFPFTARMPNDDEDREPTAELVVANVTREIIDELRSISSPLNITMKVVLADSPSVIEWGPVEMDVHSAMYDADAIVLQLGMQAMTREPFPYWSFTPANFPGLFKK